MFTKNFINVQRAWFENTGYTSDPTSQEIVYAVGTKTASVTIAAVSAVSEGVGYWMKTGRCQALPTSYANSAWGPNPGVYFGSGSTPAKKTDANLESLIDSGLEVTSPQNVVEYSDGNGRYEFVSDFVVRNTSESEINIFEIGLFLSVRVKSSQYYPMLVERTVLSEPVTIAPGEAKLVTYKLTFNQAMNVE